MKRRPLIRKGFRTEFLVTHFQKSVIHGDCRNDESIESHSTLPAPGTNSRFRVLGRGLELANVIFGKPLKYFGGLSGFLAATKGQLKKGVPFFVGGEDCFCTRELPNGAQYGSLDRKAIIDSNLTLMIAEGPSIVADHAFTTGQIPLSSFEKPLVPTRMKVGINDGWGCFPERLPAEKNTNTFIPDDLRHELGTNFVVKGKGLVVLTSCSPRGVVNTVKQAQAASGIQKVHAIIGGMHLVPPLTDDYIRETVLALKAINPDYIMAAHCSGDTFYDIAKTEMPNKVIRSAVGTRLVFGA